MIDTFSLAFRYPKKLPLNELIYQQNWHSLNESSSNFRQKWINNGDKNSNLPQLTIFSTPIGDYWLSVKGSMPKLLFGSNVRLPTEDEFNFGLKTVAEYASDKALFRFNPDFATVSRVDYTQNLYVGEYVTPYILAASRFNLANFRRHVIDDETVYFQRRKKPFSKNKQPTSVLKFYNKQREVLSRENAASEEVKAAEGVLRIEYSFHTSKRTKRLADKLGYKDNSARSLFTQATSDAVMRTNEVQYCLNSFKTVEMSTMKILLDCYPTRKASLLRGFLDLVKLSGEDCYKNPALKISRSWYYGNARECRKAGAWLEDAFE